MKSAQCGINNVPQSQIRPTTGFGCSYWMKKEKEGGGNRNGAANLWERASISSLKQTDRMLLLLLLLQRFPVSVQFEQQASNVAAAAVALCLRFPFQFAVALASLI